MKAFRAYLARNINWLLVTLLIMVLVQPDVTINNARVVITFGTPEAYAAGTADYSLGTNGATNAALIQTALNALPNQGGLLHFKVGTYNVTTNASGAITRAIGNVTIEGEGRGTLFTGNGSFTAGGNQWVFRDLALNATGMISMGATTGWSWVNVYDQATLWNSRVQSGQVVFATANGTTLFITSLNGSTINATQITGTTGNLTNAYIASLNMSGDILPTSNNTRNIGSSSNWFANVWANLVTAINGVFNTVNATTLNAPTGRGATIFIASINASTTERSQADYALDGVADNIEIQAAIDAMTVGGLIKFSSGVFYLADEIAMTDKDGVTIEGSGIFGTTTPAVGTVFYQATDNKSIFLVSSSQGVVFKNFSAYAATTTGTVAFNVTSASNNIYFEGLYLLRFDTLFDVSGESTEISWDRVQGGQGTTNYGIKMVSGQDISITNSFFPTTSTTGKSIYLSDVDWATVIGNELRDSGYGVYITGGGRYGRIIGNTFGGLDNAGIEIYANGTFPSRIIISSNTFDATAANATPGNPEDTNIYIHGDAGGNINFLTITDNVFNRGTSPHPYYGIYLSNVGNNRISNNQLNTGYYTTAIEIVNTVGGFTYPYSNTGYITENSGNFTITAGQWGASIAHSLATNATAVQLTLTGNTTTTVYVPWSSITSTNFTANLSALQGGDVTGVWRAVIGAGN